MTTPKYRATATSRRTVLIPKQTRRLPEGVWLYASTNPFVIAAENATSRLARVRTFLVPGLSVTWEPPLPADAWVTWLEHMQVVVGRIARWVVARPLDARRRRFSLLMLDDRDQTVAFAKFTRNELDETAIRAHRALSALPPSACWIPPLLDQGHIAAWSYRLMGSMPQQAHWPARLSGMQRHSIVDEYQTIWRRAQISPQSLIHGDFGPWNVRRLRDGRIAVVDWEEVKVGAPAADEVWHAVTSRLVRRVSPRRTAELVIAELAHLQPSQIRDAVDHWLASWHRPEPSEVQRERPKPVRITRFENRILDSLRIVREGLPSV